MLRSIKNLFRDYVDYKVLHKTNYGDEEIYSFYIPKTAVPNLKIYADEIIRKVTDSWNFYGRTFNDTIVYEANYHPPYDNAWGKGRHCRESFLQGIFYVVPK